MHACEGEMVIEGILEKVPYFNAPIYLENKTQIGKVEEIMGPIHKYLFSVKTSEGVKADSFKKDDKVCFRFVFLMYFGPRDHIVFGVCVALSASPLPCAHTQRVWIHKSPTHASSHTGAFHRTLVTRIDTNEHKQPSTQT